MNYEEKYKEALKSMRDLYNKMRYLSSTDALATTVMLENAFPELRESEYEKTRKAILELVKQSSAILSPMNQNSMIAWLEKKTEEKPVDKVEPKFKIEKGKWYVCNTSRYTDFVVGKAYYCPKNGMLKPNENEIARYVARDCFHPWTIQDAKDGDVLYCKNDDNDIVIIVMYQGINIHNNVDSYCRYNSKLGFNTYITNVLDAEHNFITPATKEQRDLLFQKMKEAGYEWDAEKKELNKIEKQDEKKPWSEEDELAIERLVDTIEIARSFKYGKPKAVYTDEILDSLINWLKSLKPNHWKPSEQNIKDLEWCADLVQDKLGVGFHRLQVFIDEIKDL